MSTWEAILVNYQQVDGEFGAVEQSGDFWMRHVQEEIFATWGDKVRVKPKSLFKFGRTANADSDVKTTVANFQGAVVNETFATTNSVDSIISSSASDTEIVVVEGHYFDGSNNFIFDSQEATLNGQTAVTLGTALCRANRIYVKDGTFGSPSSDLVGDVYVYDATAATGTTAGVPAVATATKCCITAGENQSRKCATSISYLDYWIVTEIFAAAEKATGSAVAVDIDVEYRKLGGVWLPLGLEMDLRTAAGPTIEETLHPPRIVPSNCDVRMVATSDTNNAAIAGHINGLLAIVR